MITVDAGFIIRGSVATFHDKDSLDKPNTPQTSDYSFIIGVFSVLSSNDLIRYLGYGIIVVEVRL